MSKQQQRSEVVVDWMGATNEDIQLNPHKYGAPTFEEFVKIRDRFFPREDDSMVFLTDGPQKFRKDLNKIIFKIHGKEVTENQVEVALGDFGYTLGDIDLENRNSRLKKSMQMIPQGGGKFDIVVDFLP